MKRFCNDLKEHVIRIINYETKPMIALTEEEKESYENQQLCDIYDKEFIQGNIEALHIVSVI